MYQLLAAIAGLLVAYLAGAARTNAKAAVAFNELRRRYDESVKEIAVMDNDDVESELDRRLHGGRNSDWEP